MSPVVDRTPAPLKPFGELATSIIGFVAALRIWQVFPFEFTGDDWTWLVRLVLAITMGGTVSGAISNLAKLVGGPRR